MTAQYAAVSEVSVPDEKPESGKPDPLLFEIGNPCDPYTVEAVDHEVAAVACCLLGDGRFSFNGINTNLEVPIFLFGGHDEWFIRQFGADFAGVTKRVLDERKSDLVACLESVLIGDATSRKTYLKGLELIETPENREDWRQHWHDQRRSSTTNIGARAWALARQIRHG
jgi:hypothetical protein